MAVQTANPAAPRACKPPQFKDFITSETHGLIHNDFIHDKPLQLALKHRLDTPNIKHNVSVNQQGKMAGLLSQSVKLSPDTTLSGSLNLDGSAVVTYNKTTIPRIHPGLAVNATVKPQFYGKDKPLMTGTFEMTLTRAPVQVKARYNSAQQQVGVGLMALLHRPARAEKLCFTSETTAKIADLSEKKSALKTTLAAGYLREVKGHTVMASVKWHGSEDKPLSKVTATLLGRSPGPLKSECAGEITYNLKDERVDLVLAGAWTANADKPNPMTLKAKINHEGQISASCSQQIGGGLGLTAGAQWDLPKIITSSSTTASPKLGLRFDLSF